MLYTSNDVIEFISDISYWYFKTGGFQSSKDLYFSFFVLLVGSFIGSGVTQVQGDTRGCTTFSRGNVNTWNILYPAASNRDFFVFKILNRGTSCVPIGFMTMQLCK